MGRTDNFTVLEIQFVIKKKKICNLTVTRKEIIQAQLVFIGDFYQYQTSYEKNYINFTQSLLKYRTQKKVELILWDQYHPHNIKPDKDSKR